jgi:hypothetical protein
MNKEEINSILEQLKEGSISEAFVLKSDFLSFREVLVQREDFKRFKGIAQRGGDVVYTYLEKPRS